MQFNQNDMNMIFPHKINEMEAKTDKEILETLKGHWVDVNGKTTLDFDGDCMTITYTWSKNTFKVKINGRYIENEKAENGNGDFGIMSSIHIGYNGTLMAYDMLLDAEGHTYNFVREEVLAKELEIKIKDRDLPKTIESEEIVSFLFNFSIEDTFYDIPKDGAWRRGRYIFEINKTGEGVYDMLFREMTSSSSFLRYSGTVSGKYVKGLAALVKEQKLAEYNGWWRTNSEKFHDWSVDIKYASGEKILMDASGRASLECPFSLNAFFEYANRAAEYAKKP